MTTQRLTREELAAIRERAERATRTCSEFSYQTQYDEEGDPDYHRLVCREGSHEAWIGEVYAEVDAEFLVNAYSDIPRLLDEIERLQKRWVYAIEHAEHLADILIPQDLSDFYSDVARYLRRIERESDAE